MSQSERDSGSDHSAADKLAIWLERSNLNDYLDMSTHPWSLIWRNFLAGVARGFGLVVGATIIVALTLVLLKQLGTLPFIGDVIKQFGHALKSNG